ncbi:MAG: hypothetical protein PVJ57_06160 [Phycisphaerae bacterium]|jgi:hypothetical protein
MLSRRNVIIIGIGVAVVLVVVVATMWWGHATAMKREAVAFAEAHLARISETWEADDLWADTTTDFKSRLTQEGLEQSAAACRKELGRFESLEVVGWQTQSMVSTGSGRETIVVLNAYGNFEKASRRQIQYRLVKRGGSWLIDNLRIQTEDG